MYKNFLLLFVFFVPFVCNTASIEGPPEPKKDFISFANEATEPWEQAGHSHSYNYSTTDAQMAGIHGLAVVSFGHKVDEKDYVTLFVTRKQEAPQCNCLTEERPEISQDTVEKVLNNLCFLAKRSATKEGVVITFDKSAIYHPHCTRCQEVIKEKITQTEETPQPKKSFLRLLLTR